MYFTVDCTNNGHVRIQVTIHVDYYSLHVTLTMRGTECLLM